MKDTERNEIEMHDEQVYQYTLMQISLFLNKSSKVLKQIAYLSVTYPLIPLNDLLTQSWTQKHLQSAHFETLKS